MRWLASDYPGAWLVIAGDITDDGHPDQYREAERLLLPWRHRLVVAPGNHDYGYLGLTYDPQCVAAWQSWCDRMGALDDVILQTKTGRVRVVAIDTCCATPGPWDLARGEVGSAELARVRGAVELRRRYMGTMRQHRLLCVTHHDPYCTDETLLLEDASEYLDAASGADWLVWGHTHREWLSADRRMRSLRDARGGDSLDYFLAGR